jgi:glycopeptide antibiotics resistance protein
MLILVIAVILWLTIFSRDSLPDPEVRYKPFHSLNNFVHYTKLYGIRNNLIGNILLFIPIGILVPLAVPWSNKWYRVLLVGFFMSLIVEVVQLLTARGYFDFDDIVLNCIGTQVGYGILRTVEKVISRKKHH